MEWGSMFCIHPSWSNTGQQRDIHELKGPRRQEQNGEIMLGSLKALVQLNFRLRIRPQVLCGISEVNLSTTVLGDKVTLPIGIAPTATQKLAHPDGEQATAKGNILICKLLMTWLS